MSDYCHLVAHGKRPRPIADGINCIPMFWIAFGSATLPAKRASTKPRQFSRERAVQNARKKLDLYEVMFPEVKALRDAGEEFVAKLEGLRCDKLSFDPCGLEVGTDWTRVPLEEAIDAVREDDTERTLVMPAASVFNPFLEEMSEHPERRFASTRELLLTGCSVPEGQLGPQRGNEPLVYLFGVF